MQYVCGRMSRAALYKEPGSRLPAAASCLGRHAHPAGRSPNSSSLFLPLAAVVAVAQRLFYPPDYSAGRCCSNPPLHPLFKADKTEAPVPGSDTGVLGGRGWIARAAQKRNPGRGSQRLHRALGGTRILLAAAPTAPPCFCRWQRSSLLHRGFFPAGLFGGSMLFESTLASLFSRQIKQKLRYPLDTGVLGGAKQPKSEPLPSGASLAAISSKVMVFVPSL